MKKIFTVAAIALLTLTTVSAQEVKKGLRAGYTRSMASGDVAGTDLKTDVRSTYYAGLFSEVKTGNFATQLELMFSPAGSKETTKIDDKEVKTVSNFGTLSLPISFKYYIGNHFAISAGPSFGFNIYRKGKVEDKSVDLKDDIKVFNFSGLVGLELNLSSGLFFDTRFNYGFSNISKIDNSKVKNHLLTVGIGYKF